MKEKVKPAIILKSNKDFYYPPSLIDDFDRFLMTDIPNVNLNFRRIPYWKTENDITEFRGEVYPINWKSRYGGSDSAINLRISLKSKLNKGDYILKIEKDESTSDIYMVTWDVMDEINNRKTQIQKVNAFIKVVRKDEKEALPQINSETGEVVEEEKGEHIIVEEIPVIGYTNVMRPDYDLQQNLPAIVPQHILLMYMQFNPDTDKIKIGDNFVWGGDEYVIIDRSVAEIAQSGKHGVLTFNAQKVAGGDKRAI